MLIKKLLTRNSYYCSFQYLTVNVRACDDHTLLKLRNCSTCLIDNRKFYHSNHQNALKSNRLGIIIPSFAPIQNILRYKNTESSTVSKDNTLEETNEKKIDKPLIRTEKLKKAVKEYGSLVIVFHIGISLISLGTCYLLVTSGLDITKVFIALGLSDWVTKSQIVTGAGTFAVAYAIHKVFMPVRITITLASVPLIVRYLRKVGFLKK